MFFLGFEEVPAGAGGEEGGGGEDVLVSREEAGGGADVEGYYWGGEVAIVRSCQYAEEVWMGRIGLPSHGRTGRVRRP